MKISARFLASIIPFSIGITGPWATTEAQTNSDRNLSTTMGHSTGLIREQCPVW